MSNRVLKLFSPFSLQLGSHQEWHQATQRLIWYAESRFRLALKSINEANYDGQTWMQDYLQDELVCVVEYSFSLRH